MPDIQTFIYIPLRAIAAEHITPGTEILVQVFLDPDGSKVIHAQLATRPQSAGTWGFPTDLVTC